MIFIGKFFRFTLLLTFLCFICVSCLKKAAEKSFNSNKKNAPYDVIIVPGYPFPDSSGTWNDLMKMRVYWSKYLYDNQFTKNIIYSGAAVYTPYVESKIMKAYGIALGIPAEHVFVDTVAKHSTENLFYSYQLAKRLGFEKIALATDPFQNVGLRRFARKKSLQVDFLPVVLDLWKDMEKINPVIDPSPAYVKDFVPLPEKAGFFKRLKGTLGGNINHEVYEGSDNFE